MGRRAHSPYIAGTHIAFDAKGRAAMMRRRSPTDFRGPSGGTGRRVKLKI